MRLQLALNVSNLAESVDFYQKMFDVKPVKVKPGYANFAIDNPPLKLVLFEAGEADAAGSINHLGVEVEKASEVEAAERRIRSAGIETTGVEETECCYAAKTETWVHAPDNAWEWYVKIDDLEAANLDFKVSGGAVSKAGASESVSSAASNSEAGGSCCP